MFFLTSKPEELKLAFAGPWKTLHPGFAKAVAVIRKDRVRVENISLRRNEGHLHVFSLK